MAQKVYEGWAQSRAAKDSLASVMQLLDQPLPADSSLLSQVPLTLTNGIRLEDVHFRYGPDLPEVLKGLHLEIRQGERIGLIGHWQRQEHNTDLLMGLLQPTAGRILVDGDDLHDPEPSGAFDAWRCRSPTCPRASTDR